MAARCASPGGGRRGATIPAIWPGRAIGIVPETPRFTGAERELLDLYEAIANDPDLYLDMQLRVGDLQLVSNHTVLHARTAYEDAPGDGDNRHLLRLWLSL
jgi:hypothetical protein